MWSGRPDFPYLRCCPWQRTEYIWEPAIFLDEFREPYLHSTRKNRWPRGQSQVLEYVPQGNRSARVCACSRACVPGIAAELSIRLTTHRSACDSYFSVKNCLPHMRQTSVRGMRADLPLERIGDCCLLDRRSARPNDLSRPLPR